MNLPMLIVIPLAPVTKKNSQQIVMVGRYPKIIPSKVYKRYEKDAGWFLPKQTPTEAINKPVNVCCTYYMPTRRRVDLVNLQEATLDVLVKYNILEDDNSRIVVSMDGSKVLYDKDNPRTEIQIHRVGGGDTYDLN